MTVSLFSLLTGARPSTGQPQIILMSQTLNERAQPGTFVGLLGVSNSVDTWSFSLTDDGGGRLALSGSQVVAGDVDADYESSISHIITVEATNGVTTLSRSFAISVGDINEAPTDILLSGSSIAENAANGTVVGTATAVDQDGDTTFSWELTDDAGGKFAIHASTGVVTKIDALDYETDIDHSITVRATDLGGLAFSKTFTISVLDFDEGEAAEAPVNTVAPTISGDAVEGQLLSTDLGTWTGNPPPSLTVQWLADDVAITDATGQTYPLTFDEIGKEITVTVTGTNVTGSDSATSDPTDVVEARINHAPTDIVLNGTSIAENAADGTEVGTCTAVDLDEAEGFGWDLTDDASGRFAIDGDTGVITKVGALDYEAFTSHDITVRVMDVRDAQFSKTFTINVLDFDEGEASAAPVNTVAPSISGTAKQDHTLTAVPGTWTGNAIPGYLYQWMRGGVAITNAVNPTYTLVLADVGTLITVEVTGRNAAGSASETSAATASVTATTFTVARFISPTVTGAGNGTSWANAAGISSLNTMISQAGADGIVYIRADLGSYTASTLTITAGGTSGHPVTVRGVDGANSPRLAVFNGNRLDPWVVGGAGGPEVIRLGTGANNLSFEFLKFTNCGNGCFRASTDAANINIESCEGDNVQRFIENNISGAATTASVTGLTVSNCIVRGFSRAFSRLRYATTVTLTDCLGDSEEQDGDNFATGFVLEGTAQATYTRCTARRCVQMQGGNQAVYWNADGFSQEAGCTGTYIDCVGEGCTDRGFDLKGTVTMSGCRASDNKLNYGFWGTANVTDSVGLDPRLRGGTGPQAQLQLPTGSTVTLTDCAFADDSPATIVYELLGTGTTLTTINTSVQKHTSATLSVLNGNTATLDTETAPPNTVLPAITGTAQVGQTLTASTGTFTGAGFSYTYQWKRAGLFISGATNNTYVVTSGDVGAALTVTVYAQASTGYVGEATSTATTAVAGTAPNNIVAPTVTGLAVVGAVLTANPGTWQGNPAPTYAYQWIRGAATNVGTDSATYTPVTGDLGSTIKCRITATNSAGTANVTTAPTAAVMDNSVVGTLYIRPARHGTASGASWTDSGSLADLPSFIAGSAPGSTINVASDDGNYAAATIVISSGGTAGNHILVQGMSMVPSAGSKATIVGTRTEWTLPSDPEQVTSVNGWVVGQTVFRLIAGANYLTFENFRGERLGEGLFYMDPADSGNASDWLHHLHFRHIESYNCRRTIEQTASATRKIGYVIIEDLKAIGYSKCCIRCRGASHDWLIKDVEGNSGRQDRDNFCMGIQFADTSHDIEMINVSMANSHDTFNAYHNGDGFTAEWGNYNLYWEDCSATGSTDGGWDTKQLASTAGWRSGGTVTEYRLRADHPYDLVRPVASDNKGNIRIWGPVLKIQDIAESSPHHRGGTGGSVHIGVSVGGVALEIDGGSMTGSGVPIGAPILTFDPVANSSTMKLTGVSINNSTDSLVSGNGTLTLINCTGSEVPDNHATFTTGTFVSSFADDWSGFNNIPLPYPANEGGDVVFAAAFCDTVGTITIADFTQEARVDVGANFSARMGWKRLTGMTLGRFDTNPLGLAGDGPARTVVGAAFDGCTPTGTPYEGYASTSGNSGTATSPTTVVSGASRKVVRIWVYGDDTAPGTTPAGWTQEAAGTFVSGNDSGYVIDTISAGAGTVAATSRTFNAGEWACFSFAIKPEAAQADTAPVNTAVPSITGSPIVGQTLTCSTGSWNGQPSPTFVRQWIRGASTNIGTNSSTYVPVTADVNSTIKCRVTATNSAGTANATSGSTAAVTAQGGVTPGGNTYFASNGATQPVGTLTPPPAIYIASLNTTLFGWESAVADGTRRAWCRNFNHTTGAWSNPVICDSRGLEGDDHGPPCFTMDHQGYVHVFSGAHANPIKHSSTTTPATTNAALSSWTVRASWFTGIINVGPYGCTYPHVVSIGNKCYVAYRTNDNGNMWACIRVGTYNNGDITWANEVVTVSFGRTPPTRMYQVNCYLRGTDIWISARKSDINVTQTWNAYVFVFDTLTGAIRNAQNTFSVSNWLTPTGSFTPLINLATADANYRVGVSNVNGSPNAMLHDSAGNFYLYWWDNQGWHESRLAAGSSTFTHAIIPVVVGAVWQTTGGNLQAVSPAGGTILVNRSAGGVWSVGGTVLAQERSQYQNWGHLPVASQYGGLGSHAHARAVWAEWWINPGQEQNVLRVYAYGESGLLRAP